MKACVCVRVRTLVNLRVSWLLEVAPAYTHCALLSNMRVSAPFPLTILLLFVVSVICLWCLAAYMGLKQVSRPTKSWWVAEPSSSGLLIHPAAHTPTPPAANTNVVVGCF